MNMLGMPLFLDYYTIYDPESGKIGWAPHTGSQKDSVTSGAVPPKSQILEVRALPVPPPIPINWVAIGSAWAFTSGILALGYFSWAKYVKPDWVVELDNMRYLAVTSMLGLFALLVSIFSIQPILYLVF